MNPNTPRIGLVNFTSDRLGRNFRFDLRKNGNLFDEKFVILKRSNGNSEILDNLWNDTDCYYHSFSPHVAALDVCNGLVNRLFLRKTLKFYFSCNSTTVSLFYSVQYREALSSRTMTSIMQLVRYRKGFTAWTRRRTSLSEWKTRRSSKIHSGSLSLRRTETQWNCPKSGRKELFGNRLCWIWK